MNSESNDIESIRPAFEAWVSGPPHYGEIDRRPYGEGEKYWEGQYAVYQIELAWQAWQEAALGEAIDRVREIIANNEKRK